MNNGKLWKKIIKNKKVIIKLYKYYMKRKQRKEREQKEGA